MKWCVEWQSTFDHLAQMDEFNIEYKRKDRKLLEFLSQYAVNNQRVNIRVNDVNDFIQHDDIKLIYGILKQNPKISIALMFDRTALYSSARNDNYLSNLNVFWYLSDTILTWEELNVAADAGVTEVIIGGELGFDLPTVRHFCDERNIRVRCKANEASAVLPMLLPGLKTFFIRPEDVDFYEDYIDIMEFEGKSDLNFLYKYYIQKQRWSGELQYLINNYSGNLNNHYIIPKDFAEKRSDCKRVCLMGPRCHYCDTVEITAKDLENSTEFEVFNRRKDNNDGEGQSVERNSV